MNKKKGYTIPLIDLSQEVHRQVIVDQVNGWYLGQPDTVLLADHRTTLVGYPLGHGGPDTVLKRSTDGGLTWSERLPVPANFKGKHVQSTHILTFSHRGSKLWLSSQREG